LLFEPYRQSYQNEEDFSKKIESLATFFCSNNAKTVLLLSETSLVKLESNN